MLLYYFKRKNARIHVNYNLNLPNHGMHLSSTDLDSVADSHQFLNEKQHQNLNNLFYDIGGRVSKYDDRLQQIVPAANQLETICRHRALTQLGQVSSVPPESPNSAVLPHSVHQ